MTKGTETQVDIILDANGAPVMQAINAALERMQKMQTVTKAIADNARKASLAFDKSAGGQVKAFEKALSRVEGLEKMLSRVARAPITQTNNDRAFASQIVKVNQFQKGLRDATTAAEAFQGRLNDIDRRVANIGGGGRINEGLMSRRLGLQQAQRDFQNLQKEIERTERFARRNSLSVDKGGVVNAEQALFGALRQQRTNLTPYFQQLERETDAYIAKVKQEQVRIRTETALPPRASPVVPSKPNLFGATGVGGIFARTAAYAGAGSLIYSAASSVMGTAKFLVDFEAQLKQLQAISGATSQQMAGVAKSIIDVGESSRFSLVDLTKMATILAQAGVAAKDMPEILKSVNALAVASGSTADEAAQLVTSSLGAFQLQASEAGHVADILTEALNRTKLNVAQIGQAIQYVGATAYEMNIPLEKVLATIGAVAQAGVKSGSTIGTGFRQFLVDLQNPTEKMTQGLQKFGLTAADVDVQTKGLTAVLAKLRDSGIGSSQAYQMMERRGAAFYLVAKNNLDIVDQLQIAFSHTGASETANAQAMDSIVAQWQRFKNIQGARLWADLAGPMAVIKNLLKDINDLSEDANSGKYAFGPPKFIQDMQNWVNDSQDEIDRIKNFGEVLVDALFPHEANLAAGERSGVGTYIRHLGDDMSDVTGKAEQFKTKINEASEAVDNKRQTVNELTSEIERLKTQEETIKSTMGGVTAETATLSSKFEGLALQLVGTTGNFNDLVAAMQRVKSEQQGLLATDLMVQAGSFQASAQNHANNAVGLRRQLMGLSVDQLHQMSLSDREIQAFRQPTKGKFSENAFIVADFARRLAAAGATELQKTWAPVFNSLAREMSSQIGDAVQSNIARSQAYDARFSATPRGGMYESRLVGDNANITKMRTMDFGARQKLGAAVIADLNGLIMKAEADIKTSASSPELVAFFKKVRQAAVEATSAARGAMALSEEEIKANKEKAAAARKALSEAKAAARTITLADFDKFGQIFMAQNGGHLGGGPRSAATQRALIAAGATRVPPERDPHVNGVARDFIFPGKSMQELQLIRAAMQRAADALFGVGVTRAVAESGHGRNQGTAPQVHLQLNNKFAQKKINFPDNMQEALEQAKQQAETAVMEAFDARAIALADKAITHDLKDLQGQLEQGVIFTAKQQASDDLEVWYTALKTQILHQAAAKGLSPDDPYVQQQLDQAKEAYDQKMEDINRATSAALFAAFEKSLKHNVEAIEKLYEKNMNPFNTKVANAQAYVSGLSYASNEGKIPDYVAANAQRKAAKAEEERDRADVEFLNQQITQLFEQLKTKQFDAIGVELTGTPDEVAQAKADLTELEQKITALIQKRDALKIGLSAGDDSKNMSVAEGFSKAAQNYAVVHGLNQSITEFINSNWTEALDKLGEGFSTFFTDIIDGSKSVKQAFGDFVKSMLQYIEQLLVKMLVMMAMKALFTALGIPMPSGGNFNGGLIGGNFNGGLIKGAYGGEHIKDGVRGRDSTIRRLAKGEFVMRSAAVDSVGVDFMRRLNEQGKGALAGPQMPQPPAVNQEVSVYVVKEDAKPQMGPRDVLVAVHDDILKDGQTKKLIKLVSQGA